MQYEARNSYFDIANVPSSKYIFVNISTDKRNNIKKYYFHLSEHANVK